MKVQATKTSLQTSTPVLLLLFFLKTLEPLLIVSTLQYLLASSGIEIWYNALVESRMLHV